MDFQMSSLAYPVSIAFTGSNIPLETTNATIKDVVCDTIWHLLTN